MQKYHAINQEFSYVFLISFQVYVAV